MTAPEKCPDCGSPIRNRADGKSICFAECGRVWFTSRGQWGIDRSDYCLERERDALLAANAELEARLAGMVSVEVVAELVTIAKDALVEAEKKLDSAARNYNAHAHNKNWRDGLSQRVKEADAKCVSIVNALARAEAEAATNAAKEKHDG